MCSFESGERRRLSEVLGESSRGGTMERAMSPQIRCFNIVGEGVEGGGRGGFLRCHGIEPAYAGHHYCQQFSLVHPTTLFPPLHFHMAHVFIILTYSECFDLSDAVGLDSDLP